MTTEEYAALKERLRAMADPSYRAFHQKLVPEVENLLGVRIPALRQLARELARGDWRGYLAAAQTDTYEETMLQGLVLGCSENGAGRAVRAPAGIHPQDRQLGGERQRLRRAQAGEKAPGGDASPSCGPILRAGRNSRFASRWSC